MTCVVVDILPAESVAIHFAICVPTGTSTEVAVSVVAVPCFHTSVCKPDASVEGGSTVNVRNSVAVGLVHSTVVGLAVEAMASMRHDGTEVNVGGTVSGAAAYAVAHTIATRVATVMAPVVLRHELVIANPPNQLHFRYSSAGGWSLSRARVNIRQCDRAALDIGGHYLQSCV